MASSGAVECTHPTCKCSFKSHASMKQHFFAIHSLVEQKPKEKYTCERCNKSFRKQESLQDHKRSLGHFTHHQYATLVPGTGISIVAHAPVCLVPASDQINVQLQTMACNDCGKAKFKGEDALHQHQWVSADHTRVSKSSNPSHGMQGHACSQCNMKLPSAEDLDLHVGDQYPIIEVLKSSKDRTWQQVEECFKSAWINSTSKLPEVHRIFKVCNTGWRRRVFEQYRKEIKAEVSNRKLIKEDDLKLRDNVLGDGNELLQYYGTTVKCPLGELLNLCTTDSATKALSLCTNKDCSLCRIFDIGFKVGRCRKKKFPKFGQAIYCSAASNKASAYVKCNGSTRKARWFCDCFGGFGSTQGEANYYRVMMVCKVIAGRPYRSTHNLHNLKSPPCGFHSVQGISGEKFNNEDLVVYDERAILPMYIILYTSSD